MRKQSIALTQAAVITAAYVALTLPFAQFAFGPIQFRLAEALTVLAALTPAAIPGLFLGCLLTNLMFPSGLGLIDVIFGSLATLLAAWLTWRLQHRLNVQRSKGMDQSAAAGLHLPAVRRTASWLSQIAVLAPAAVINALVVGFYLPFLLPDTTVSIWVIASFMLSIFISECIVIYLIGFPLLLALRRSGLVRDVSQF